MTTYRTQNNITTLPFTETRGTPDNIPSLYQLKSPYQLHLCEFHPDQEENCYISTIISPDFHISVSETKTNIMPHLKPAMHHHNYYEILFVLEGEVTQIIENRRHLYPRGSFCLLNKKVSHTEEYSNDFSVIFMHLSDDLIKEIYRNLTVSFFPKSETKKTDLLQFLETNLSENEISTRNYVDFVPLKDSDWTEKHIISAIESIWKETVCKNEDSSSIILEEWNRLFRYLNHRGCYKAASILIGTDNENRIFDQITELLQKSDGHISRSKLSEALNYSGVYLNNIVKKHTGLSLYDYGMTFCMKKTASLLRETSKSITDISIEMGFSNRTHFNKIFQDTYHMTPSAYRICFSLKN